MKSIQNSPLYFLEYLPNLKASDGSPAKLKNLENRSDLSDELVVMVKKDNGQKVTFTSRTVNYQNKVFIAPLPNPVHILLNSGIGNYNNSIMKLEILKNDCMLDDNANEIHILNIGLDNTNSNFNDLVKFRMISVISLVTALEAFLNQVIPNDFIYRQFKYGKTKKLNKKKIESPFVSFKEKLTDLIDQLLDDDEFSINNDLTIQPIIELYDLRREVIHLKTYSENEMGLYFKSIGKLIDIELELIIISIKKYINLIKPDFIKE